MVLLSSLRVVSADIPKLFPGATVTANGWQARCPAHEDKKASLSISTGTDGKTLLHCHAGCTPEAVCAAVGIKLADLMPPRIAGNGKSQIVATYDYTDEAGKRLFQVCRFDPKDFRQRRPDGKGGWTWSTKGIRRVPYHLPDLIAAVRDGRPVFIAEGEKDVDALRTAGFAATCNAGGAGKWPVDFAAFLARAEVTILADKDEPGRKHAAQVAANLHPVAAAVRVVELPDVDWITVKDAADFLEAGGTAAQLDEITQSAPLWNPAADVPASEPETARTIGSLLPPTPDDGTELLRSRFLCRGGGALLVGQSGQGKSSLVVQMTLLWSIGRACFGFTPAQSLRTLIVQAENDDGDLHEMFCGICDGLQLSPEDRRRAGDSVLIFNEDCRSGDVFMAQLDTLATRYTPDLIVIDPALAYVNGDTKDAEAVGAFLRRGLNPILHRHNCGGIVVHHTTKQRADGPQATHDFLYSGAGSIEWTNWARAVLSLETKGNGCFALHAPKRGSRIGWKLPDGRPEFVRFIRHARSPGTICWQDVDAGEVEQVSRTGKSKADLLAHVPATEPIPQTVLLEKANAAGIGQKKARAFLDELITDGALHLWLVKRKGTNPEKRVSRHPQPL